MRKPSKIGRRTAGAAAAPRRSPLRVVGIGASAGGLAALEKFFRAVPADSALAFVVVQHLDPDHKGLLPELLQRSTALPVRQVKDGVKVRAGRVYVIPPNRGLSMRNGALRLSRPAALRGQRLPIDGFLCSLAEDLRARAVGVILSGMGSDGTQGLRALKEAGGAVFVQAPATAEFDSMPRSAIDAGLADVVGAPAELPGLIESCLNRFPGPPVLSEKKLSAADFGLLEKVLLLLRARTGHDFSRYKKSTICRRIERRMGLHRLAKLSGYLGYLRDNAHEADLLFKELLIGVTGFFRDPEAWALLRKTLPSLLAARPDGAELRAWVAGCSTGEEAYSLAILLREALDKLKPGSAYSLQIFATDLDKDAVDRARAGVYPAGIAAEVPAAALRRFFEKDNRGYKVSKELREMVIFAQQNLAGDPPFTKIDVLTCRNLLIYLEPDLQDKVLRLFHYSLNPGGLLLLGNSETTGRTAGLFTSLSAKCRLYRRRDGRRAEAADFPSGYARRAEAARSVYGGPSPVNLQGLVETLLLKRYSPAAVLTTEGGDILYISGKTGRFLEPAAGKANLNVFVMAREGLGAALNEAYSVALRQGAALSLKGVKVRTETGEGPVDIMVQPLAEPASLRGMVLAAFTDGAAEDRKQRAGKSTALASLRQALLRAQGELQDTREEMQTSQEEVRSANEELQSTNEELQSTNEELTTSKEELQSMNEELQTVNRELQAKLDEMSRAADDMKNLLNSTDIATLFLDEKLKVRRFTTQAVGLIKLIPGDVGRPITDLVSELEYPGMAEDSREVLRSLVYRERQVASKDGRWFNARIMPYRTRDNRIDGVVITFTDVSAYKALETASKEAAALLQGEAGPAAREAASALGRVLEKARTLTEKGRPR